MNSVGRERPKPRFVVDMSPEAMTIMLQSKVLGNVHVIAINSTYICPAILLSYPDFEFVANIYHSPDCLVADDFSKNYGSGA